MIPFEDIEISPQLAEAVNDYLEEIEEFRNSGPLDQAALAKLEEHFKASHVYHSAGIEGNTLTMQETLTVLQQGIDISGKPLKDSMEAKHLANAFDYLMELSGSNGDVRGTDIRSLHQLIIEGVVEKSPGEYRQAGVIISGSDHTPPDPTIVPSRMDALVKWINQHQAENPLLVSALAHHELTSIHPFMDGNGRVARLLMNLLLMKHGIPVANLAREERPKYYEVLAFADIDEYGPLVQIVLEKSRLLFKEYRRLRDEQERMTIWASKRGIDDHDAIRRREQREFELWRTRMKQAALEFERCSDLLADKLQSVTVEFHPYAEIELDHYLEIKTRGEAKHSNSFSVGFRNQQADRYERLMFRFHRNRSKFGLGSEVVPLEVNYFKKDDQRYVRLCDLADTLPIRLREIYFDEAGKLHQRYYNFDEKTEAESTKATMGVIAEQFFDDVLKNLMHVNR